MLLLLLVDREQIHIGGPLPDRRARLRHPLTHRPDPHQKVKVVRGLLQLKAPLLGLEKQRPEAVDELVRLGRHRLGRVARVLLAQQLTLPVQLLQLHLSH